MTNLISTDIPTMIQNIKAMWFWLLLGFLSFVLPPIIASWPDLKKQYNHKGYWFKGINLEEYIDNVSSDSEEKD